MAEFQKSTEALVKAGVVVGDGRLYPSAQGKRLRFDGKKRSVIDGPFAETKELVAGYWLWQVRSIDEALEWLKRAPYDGGTFEVREGGGYEGLGRSSRPRVEKPESACPPQGAGDREHPGPTRDRRGLG